MTDPISRAERFEQLYRNDPDPWRFETSAYEQAKYAATLAALPLPRFNRGLEIGCSIGVLTRLLADRCAHLQALDIAPTALDTARRRCAGLDHVCFRRMAVPQEWPDGMFDLIILSEILYFMSPAEIIKTAELSCACLSEGGAILLVNWTGDVGGPHDGDAAARRFIGASGRELTPIRQRSADSYRLDLLCRPFITSGQRASPGDRP